VGSEILSGLFQKFPETLLELCYALGGSGLVGDVLTLGDMRDSESPTLALKTRNNVEVLIAAQHRQAVLKGEGRDPGVVGRDRTP